MPYLRNNRLFEIWPKSRALDALNRTV